MENLLQATEKQGFMVTWLAVTAVVNLCLDAALIPKNGALGAAVANGLAQTMGVAGLFFKAGGADAMRSQRRFLGALCLSGAVMVSAVAVVIRALPSRPGLFAGVGVGTGVFLLCLRMTRSLEAEDCERLRPWVGRLPEPIGKIMLQLLAPRRGTDSTTGDAVAASNSNQ
jgi:O-antigen/teichoic acid export membrane protein